MTWIGRCLNCWRASLALATLLATPAALADPLDFYAGVGVGRTTLNLGATGGGIPAAFDEKGSAWKALVGLRPLALIGAKVEYANLGQPHATLAQLNTQATANVSAAFAVLYAPLPLPLVDLYAKLGMARLNASANGTPTGALKTLCESDTLAPGCKAAVNTSTQTTAWGLGSQVRVASLAGRLEYERFGHGSITPGLLSVSVLWHF